LGGIKGHPRMLVSFQERLGREGKKERFPRADSRGRGLHIATRLIEHMGGSLNVETLNGQTIFRVFLPIVLEANNRGE